MATAHFTPSRVPVLLAALASGVLLLLATASAATGSSGAPPEPTPYIVEAGDTLWSISDVAYGGDGDTREIIHSIKELNELDGTGLSIGQVLLLPAG